MLRFSGPNGWVGAGRRVRTASSESRHPNSVFPFSLHGPARSRPMAGNADRAVLYDFRRFPARILATSNPLDQPLKVLCELGGWKNAKTVLACYQQPDEGQLRKALEARRGASG